MNTADLLRLGAHLADPYRGHRERNGKDYSAEVLLRLEPAMLDRISELACARGRTRSAEIRVALERHLVAAASEQARRGTLLT